MKGVYGQSAVQSVEVGCMCLYVLLGKASEDEPGVPHMQEPVQIILHNEIGKDLGCYQKHACVGSGFGV